ncbi:hypothetical protein BO94DRAFT_590497 [Aspergillus sclerotioniger CBS 115572]|uniref:Uncharacterized protein n=1 Tax=Aspergillus sclerotioniger CBS 115572 TaxID=1450535 RepID=A0A317V5A5_9EURO|nr:hypothetical protein BO94DRAFT_590497 [Aspergillus sclerotioniger CBS 115572]PWY69196.1 hypothetical protein BO94DRAFT_590497 [Aspergillus sclerotioniger CBS 115572]
MTTVTIGLHRFIEGFFPLGPWRKGRLSAKPAADSAQVPKRRWRKPRHIQSSRLGLVWFLSAMGGISNIIVIIIIITTSQPCSFTTIIMVNRGVGPDQTRPDQAQ